MMVTMMTTPTMTRTTWAKRQLKNNWVMVLFNLDVFMASVEGQEAPEAESILSLKSEGTGGIQPIQAHWGRQARWKPVEEMRKCTWSKPLLWLWHGGSWYTRKLVLFFSELRPFFWSVITRCFPHSEPVVAGRGWERAWMGWQMDRYCSFSWVTSPVSDNPSLLGYLKKIVCVHV